MAEGLVRDIERVYANRVYSLTRWRLNRLRKLGVIAAGFSGGDCVPTALLGYGQMVSDGHSVHLRAGSVRFSVGSASWSHRFKLDDGGSFLQGALPDMHVWLVQDGGPLIDLSFGELAGDAVYLPDFMWTDVPATSYGAVSYVAHPYALDLLLSWLAGKQHLIEGIRRVNSKLGAILYADFIKDRRIQSSTA